MFLLATGRLCWLEIRIEQPRGNHRRCKVQPFSTDPDRIGCQIHAVQRGDVLNQLLFGLHHGVCGGFWWLLVARRPVFRGLGGSPREVGPCNPFWRGIAAMSEMGNKKSPGIVVGMPQSPAMDELVSNERFLVE